MLLNWVMSSARVEADAVVAALLPFIVDEAPFAGRLTATNPEVGEPELRPFSTSGVTLGFSTAISFCLRLMMAFFRPSNLCLKCRALAETGDH